MIKRLKPILSIVIMFLLLGLSNAQDESLCPEITVEVDGTVIFTFPYAPGFPISGIGTGSSFPASTIYTGSGIYTSPTVFTFIPNQVFPSNLTGILVMDFTGAGFIVCHYLNGSLVQCSHPDYAALMALYNSTDGPNWDNNSGWSEGASGVNCDPCTWYGITCVADRVTEISLFYNELTGQIPVEIGQMTNLTKLFLNGNNLTGIIPVEIGQLTNLTLLYLADNYLTGPIPIEIGQLTNLTFLDVSFNQLTGPIPEEFGQLTKLQQLYLSNNQLSGPIPPVLGQLPDLIALLLRLNQFSGSIPPELGQLSELRLLYLHDNQLTGSIPAEFGQLSLLDELRLFNNQLSGCFDSNLHSLCIKNFTNEEISNGNNFEAEWEDFCSPTGQNTCLNGNLIICDTDCNGIPNNAENCYPELYIFYEELNGDDWYNNAGWLQDCDPCGWYGITCNASNQIVKIDLSNDSLVGVIPASIDQLVHLEELLLGGNYITGDIPVELGNLDNLYRLALADNELNGTLSDAAGLLANVRFLYLQNNNLTGPLPPNLNDNPVLEQLILLNNNFTGPIPDLSNLPDLLVLDLRDNALTGSIPLGLSPSLARLRLDNNLLTGPIPEYIGNLPIIEIFTATNNDLSGCFPSSLQNLCDIPLFFLDLNPNLPDSGDKTQFCSNGYGECGSWDCNGNNLIINDVPLPNGTIKMSERIESAGTVQAPNSMVTFQAGQNIVLMPNFTVAMGTVFIAEIEACD